MSTWILLAFCCLASSWSLGYAGYGGPSGSTDNSAMNQAGSTTSSNQQTSANDYIDNGNQAIFVQSGSPSQSTSYNKNDTSSNNLQQNNQETNTITQDGSATQTGTQSGSQTITKNAAQTQAAHGSSEKYIVPATSLTGIFGGMMGGGGGGGGGGYGGGSGPSGGGGSYDGSGYGGR